MNGRARITSAPPTMPARSSASYLAPLNLAEYVTVVDAAGGELPSDIADFTQAELIEEFGMKRLHAKKLRKWLDTRAASAEVAGASGAPSPPLLPVASAGEGAAASKQSDAATLAVNLPATPPSGGAAASKQSAGGSGSSSGPLVFSRVGVPFEVMQSLVDAFRTATRWLLDDGFTTRVGVAIVDRALVLERPSGAKVEIIACVGEIIARSSDSRLFTVEAVRRDDAGRTTYYSLQVIKTYVLPTPCAKDGKGRPCLDAAVGTPCADDVAAPSVALDKTPPPAFELDEASITTARHLATMNEAKQHVVTPLTERDGPTFAQAIGTALDATIFFSWGFRQRLDHFLDAFAAFIKNQQGASSSPVAWISLMCTDQHRRAT